MAVIREVGGVVRFVGNVGKLGYNIESNNNRAAGNVASRSEHPKGSKQYMILVVRWLYQRNLCIDAAVLDRFKFLEGIIGDWRIHDLLLVGLPLR